MFTGFYYVADKVNVSRILDEPLPTANVANGPLERKAVEPTSVLVCDNYNGDEDEEECAEWNPDVDPDDGIRSEEDDGIRSEEDDGIRSEEDEECDAEEECGEVKEDEESEEDEECDDDKCLEEKEDEEIEEDEEGSQIPSVSSYEAIKRAEMRTLASYLDKDEDGMVTRYEVVEVWMNTLLQRLFKAFDLDGSGGIGLSWLEDTLKNPLGVFLRQPFLEFIADEIFDLVDVDNDGIADEGELQTFSNLSLDTLCVLFVYECPFLGKYLLSFVDRNHDGRVSADEFTALKRNVEKKCEDCWIDWMPTITTSLTSAAGMGKSEQEELQRYLFPFLITLPRALLRTLIKAADADGNNEMDWEELNNFSDFDLIFTEWQERLADTRMVTEQMEFCRSRPCLSLSDQPVHEILRRVLTASVLQKAFLNFWYQDCVYSPSNLVWKYVARSLLDHRIEMTRDLANLYIGCDDDGPTIAGKNQTDYQQLTRISDCPHPPSPCSRSSEVAVATYLDANRDGVLTRVEFDQKVTSLLKMVFDGLDVGGDGAIGVEEATVDNFFRPDFLRNLTNELFDLADTDDDGYIELSWISDELMDQRSRIFYAMDRDRDGRLSNSELESMVIALHCFFTRCYTDNCNVIRPLENFTEKLRSVGEPPWATDGLLRLLRPLLVTAPNIILRSIVLGENSGKDPDFAIRFDWEKLEALLVQKRGVLLEMHDWEAALDLAKRLEEKTRLECTEPHICFQENRPLPKAEDVNRYFADPVVLYRIFQNIVQSPEFTGPCYGFRTYVHPDSDISPGN